MPTDERHSLAAFLPIDSRLPVYAVFPPRRGMCMDTERACTRQIRSGRFYEQHTVETAPISAAKSGADYRFHGMRIMCCVSARRCGILLVVEGDDHRGTGHAGRGACHRRPAVPSVQHLTLVIRHVRRHGGRGQAVSGIERPAMSSISLPEPCQLREVDGGALVREPELGSGQ